MVTMVLPLSSPPFSQSFVCCPCLTFSGANCRHQIQNECIFAITWRKSGLSIRWLVFWFSYSGAHMNAAVTFTMCVLGRLSWKMFPLYVVAQLLGSFIAAGTVFTLYYGKSTCMFSFKALKCTKCFNDHYNLPTWLFIDAIYHYCEGNFTVFGPKATAGIFATYPAPYLSIHTGFLDQVWHFLNTHNLSCHGEITNTHKVRETRQSSQ